jgi:hypothetical protein
MAMNFEVKLHNFEDFDVGGKMWDRIEIPWTSIKVVHNQNLILNI